jgi:hypothetical protein
VKPAGRSLCTWGAQPPLRKQDSFFRIDEEGILGYKEDLFRYLFRYNEKRLNQACKQFLSLGKTRGGMQDPDESSKLDPAAPRV